MLSGSNKKAELPFRFNESLFLYCIPCITDSCVTVTFYGGRGHILDDVCYNRGSVTCLVLLQYTAWDTGNVW